jgi:hypothetical protein
MFLQSSQPVDCGMGVVYRAAGAKLNRDAAIKVPPGVPAADPIRGVAPMLNPFGERDPIIVSDDQSDE